MIRDEARLQTLLNEVFADPALSLSLPHIYDAGVLQVKAAFSGSLAHALLAFLDARNLQATLCRMQLSQWPIDGHVSIIEFGLCLILIQRECPTPALGLEIGKFFRPEHIGTLGYLCLSSDTFADLIKRFERFFPLMWRGYKLETNYHDELYTAVVELDPLPSALFLNDAFLMDAMRLSATTAIAGITHIIRTLCGHDFNPAMITIEGSSPTNLSPYEDFFGCPVHFSKTQSIVSFSTDYFSKPIFSNKALPLKALELKAETELKNLEKSDAFLTAFFKELTQSLHLGKPTMAYVAKALDISRATLQRKLNDRNITFQATLDQTRLERAKIYLADPTISIIEISLLLAFSEQSAFARFFKRETGLTPLQYRKQICG